MAIHAERRPAVVGGSGERRDRDQLEQRRLPFAERQRGKMELHSSVGNEPLNKLCTRIVNMHENTCLQLHQASVPSKSVYGYFRLKRFLILMTI